MRALSGVRQSAAYYGLTMLALQDGDGTQALEYHQLAIEHGRQAPMLARQRIDIARVQKNPALSLQVAHAAFTRWPDSRALALSYAQALQDNGRDREAVAFLRDRGKSWAQDEPRVFHLLAQSQSRAGDDVSARRDMARYYVAVGALQACESQLQQARGMTQDFYEQSQIDVQIREIRERIDAQRQLLERFKS